jgi:hypothetical protein
MRRHLYCLPAGFGETGTVIGETKSVVVSVAIFSAVVSPDDGSWQV